MIDECRNAVRPRPAAATIVNLFVPGGGLILRDELLLGLVLAGVFAFALNFTLAGRYLFPLNITPGWQRFGTLLVVVTYFTAQLRMIAAQRAAERRAVAEKRRALLLAARAALQSSDPQAARTGVEMLRAAAGDDLHVAVRVAQLARASGDANLFDEAWQKVRRLDRHRLYRDGIPPLAQPLSPATPAPGAGSAE